MSGATESPFSSLPTNQRPAILDLDGSNDDVSMSRPYSGDTYTIAFWMYMDSGNPSGRTYIYETRTSGGGQYIFYDGTSSNGQSFCGGGNPPNFDLQGQWTHHVIRAAGTSLTYTINGTGNYNWTGSSGNCTATGPALTLGSHQPNSSGNYHLNGKYAELAIWEGKRLSDAEVDAVFNNRLPLLFEAP